MRDDSTSDAAAWPARIVLFALALLSTPCARGAEDAIHGIWSAVVENDIFYNNDRGYTNGLALAYVPTDPMAPDWAAGLVRRLPWVPAGASIRHGYAFGQSMFTPRDITRADPPLDDRPYAGWLYATFGLGMESGQLLDQIAVSAGVVGPASLAAPSQKLIHRITASTAPQGWDAQLGNEPALLMTYQRNWRELASIRLAGLTLDFTPHVGVAAGNVYTYASAGGMVRLGPDLPLDFGPPRAQPSVTSSALFKPAQGTSWYLFAGFEGRAVARDIFLDGNTWRHSRSVDKEPFVGDLQLGIAMTWHHVRLSYTHVLRSREFKVQTGRGEFGALAVSVAF